jgi:peptidoglycan/LPS O-acetylase OafA/YrhL
MTATTPATGASRRLGYRPALDGIRALAIIAVLGFHAPWPHAGGGYLGVDVFFALSGFLITSLLIDERAERGRVDLRAFWLRRALRLLPALVALLVGLGAYAAIRPSATSVAEVSNGFARDAFGTLFYVQNWAVALTHSYHPYLLSHTWSLSVEEQFYLLWPPVLIVLLARVQWRTVVLVTAAGIVTSSALRAGLSRSRGITPRVVFGLDTRASALLLGCLLALLLAHRRDAARVTGRFVIALGAVGMAVLVWLVVGSRYAAYAIWANPSLMIDEAYTVARWAACAVIASVVLAPTTPLARALSVRPLVWLGRISYALYLWHWPVDVVLAPSGSEPPTLALQLARVVVSVALASGSYYVVERRFLALKARTQRVRDLPVVHEPAIAPAAPLTT